MRDIIEITCKYRGSLPKGSLKLSRQQETMQRKGGNVVDQIVGKDQSLHKTMEQKRRAVDQTVEFFRSTSNSTSNTSAHVPSAHYFNCIEGCQIIEGTLRTGVVMKGVFNNGNTDIPENTFLCAWTGIVCEDTKKNLVDSKLVNAYDMSRYAMATNKIYICPPLDNDGNPFCNHVKDNVYDITRGDDTQSMAVFLNEPSSSESCTINDENTPTISNTKKTSNVCMKMFVINEIPTILLFSRRKIEKGEELTLIYDTGYKFTRKSFTFSNNFLKMTVGPSYRVNRNSNQSCRFSTSTYPSIPSMLPIELTTEITENTFFQGDNDENAARRTTLLVMHMDDPNAGTYKIVHGQQRRLQHRIIISIDEKNKRSEDIQTIVVDVRVALRDTLFTVRPLKKKHVYSFVRSTILDASRENPFNIPSHADTEIEEPIAVYKILMRIMQYVKDQVLQKVTPAEIVTVNEGDTLETWESEEWKDTNTYTLVKKIFDSLDRLNITLPLLDSFYSFYIMGMSKSNLPIKRPHNTSTRVAQTERRWPKELSRTNTFINFKTACEKYLREYILFGRTNHGDDILEFMNFILPIMKDYSRLNEELDANIRWIHRAEEVIEIMKTE